jgi:hypothetical protein
VRGSGKRPISTPISAISSWAKFAPTPVISSNRWAWPANGAIARSISALSWPIVAVAASMRPSISWHRKP